MLPKNAPLEKDIQRKICDWLHDNGYFFWRNNNIPAFSIRGGKMIMRTLPKYTPRGLPDIIVIYQGAFIGIEVKRPGRYGRTESKLTEDQANFGIKCEENGGRYLVIRSVEELIVNFSVYYEKTK